MSGPSIGGGPPPERPPRGSAAADPRQRSGGVSGGRECLAAEAGGRQVQRLDDERRQAPRATAGRLGGVAQDQLVASPGHRDVEQAALLLEVPVALRQHLVHQLDREREWLARERAGKPVRDEAGQEHDRELEALGLVDGHHVDRVHVRVRISGRRIVAGLDERRQVAGEEHRAIVGEERRLRADDVEEPPDVGELLLGRHGRGAGELREPARVAQERVEDLARGSALGQLPVSAQVGGQPGEGGAARRRDSAAGPAAPRAPPGPRTGSRCRRRAEPATSPRSPAGIAYRSDAAMA